MNTRYQIFDKMEDGISRLFEVQYKLHSIYRNCGMTDPVLLFFKVGMK